MKDLERLRDQGIHEGKAREVAQHAADRVARDAIATTAKVAIARAVESPTIRAEVLALHDAAGLPPPDPWTFRREVNQRMDDLARQLGRRYSPRLATLDNFHVYDASGEQAAVLQRVREFIADMENVLRETRGLVLYGSVGTGKDHLLAAALYHVARAGIPVGWVNAEDDIYLRVRDSMDSGELEDRILGPMVKPVVLGISDPLSPRGALGDWDVRILARLLDRRYRALRPTWLTMNAIDEADAKTKLTSLIWDRFQDGAEVIPCFWSSFRGLRGKRVP
jgi:DNA replication protein DnaC